ncbi:hypothetical protein DP73_15830 [Desulfosporosinus sp. HMP52]|nr:hypothetical protein DP73_15830 [Desulfosporosinus sp. HMP52]
MEAVATDSDSTEKIRRFAMRIELNVRKSPDQEKRKQVLSFIKWTRNKVDWIDPLIERKRRYKGEKLLT